jgi:DeoR family glycerol-3-phosphate regulon repressor
MLRAAGRLKREAELTLDAENALRRIPAGARHARILDLIHRNGFISVTEVAESFAVSDMTIRRDLWMLEEKGMLVRTHGGAVGAGRREVFDADEPAFSSRRRRNAAAKAAIARAAVRLIGPRDSIGLDVGTTTLALAEEIAEHSSVTVFTNNLHAAAALGRSRCPVHVPGGVVRGPELSVVGSKAVEQIGHYYLTKVFLGVSGLIEEGFFDYSPEDTDVKRGFIAQSEQVIVLCDSSKFDHRSLVKVCDLGQVTALVTDAPPPQHLAEALERAGASIVVAEPLGTPVPTAA